MKSSSNSNNNNSKNENNNEKNYDKVDNNDMDYNYEKWWQYEDIFFFTKNEN